MNHKNTYNEDITYAPLKGLYVFVNDYQKGLYKLQESLDPLREKHDAMQNILLNITQ